MQRIYFHILCLASLINAGCGRAPEKYSYEEIVIESPLKTSWQGADDPHAAFRGMPALNMMSPDNVPPELLTSKAEVPLTWTTPAGWQELPGSGFRLATFKAGEGDSAIETSIVSLSGAAGGAEANILRWMTQINLKAPSDGLMDFLKEKGALTEEGEIEFVDFTKLQDKALPSTLSTYAGILQADGSTVFVKMTGSIEAINQRKDAFRSLTKSIQVKK